MKLSLVDDHGELLEEWRVELEQLPPDNVEDMPDNTYYLRDFRDSRTYPFIGRDIADEVLRHYQLNFR